MGDFLFDSAMERFVDPVLDNGCLNCAGTYLHDQHDASKFVKGFKEFAEAHSIKGLFIRNNQLSVMPEMEYQLFLRSTALLHSLKVVRVQNCGLRGQRFESFVSELLNLPSMQGTAVDYQFQTDGSRDIEHAASAKVYAEVNLKNNSIDDKTLRGIGLAYNKRLQQRPAFGVSKLVLSDNNLSDDAMNVLVTTFPNLIELHLSKNPLFRGQLVEGALVRYLKNLEVLNLDATGIDRSCVTGIQNVMKRRSSNPHSKPLEVCIREISFQDDSWLPLLEFCHRKANCKKFTLKHDLQESMGELPCRRELVHTDVHVKVWFSGTWPLTIVDDSVMATTSPVEFVKQVLVELNGASLEPVTGKGTRKVRNRYREAFKTLLNDTGLGLRVFAAESATMTVYNKYNASMRRVDALHEDGVRSILIGAPSAGINVSFDIVTCVDHQATRQLAISGR